MVARNIRLWQRDQDIITEAARSPMLTSQIARLHGFPSRKKAAERLNALYQAGLLKRVPHFLPAMRGNPEFDYYLGARPQPRTLAHTIAVAEIHVQIVEWLRTIQGYTADFFFPHEVPTTGGIIPDATLLVRKGEKTGLYFFEVDNGTEVVTSPTRYSLAKKLTSYATYFDTEQYLGDFAPWAGALRGFRVCLIVPTGRLRHLQHLVDNEHHDFVLMTTFDLLKEGFHRPVWATHDGSSVTLLGRPS